MRQLLWEASISFFMHYSPNRDVFLAWQTRYIVHVGRYPSSRIHQSLTFCHLLTSSSWDTNDILVSLLVIEFCGIDFKDGSSAFFFFSYLNSPFLVSSLLLYCYFLLFLLTRLLCLWRFLVVSITHSSCHERFSGKQQDIQALQRYAKPGVSAGSVFCLKALQKDSKDSE